MRTFIAIELPQEIKDGLARLQSQLKKAGADVKWVKPKNIHLTLKFLGEISAKQLPKVIEIIEEVTRTKKQFKIGLSSCGAFPGKKAPRVIWVGVNKGNEEIRFIVQELEEKMEEIGIPKEERPFSSHITIGRVKGALNTGKLSGVLKESENYPGGENIEFDVRRLTLFKSTLGQAGPSYEALKEVSITTA